MRCTIALLVAWLATSPLLGQGQPPADEVAKDKKPPAAAPRKDTPPKVATLDQLIAEAMKNNPDIRVADAKLREAQAEAERARLKVAADIASLHGDIAAARAAEENGLLSYDRAKSLFERKVISREDFDASKASYQSLSAKRAALEAKLPYLLGRQPGLTASAAIDEAILKKWLSVGTDQGISDTEFLRRVVLDFHGRVPTPEETKEFLKLPEKERRQKWMDKLHKDVPAQPGHANDAVCMRCHVAPMRINRLMDDPNFQREWVEKVWAMHFNVESKSGDKLRKALDAKMRLVIEDALLGDVLDHVREKGGLGLNIHVRAKGLKEQQVTVKLAEPVAIGAILQYLEDELKIVFVLRDYGIVVSAAEDRLPPGAVRVVDYWKHEPPAKPADPDKGKAPEKTKADAFEFKNAIIRTADMSFRTRGIVVKVDSKGQSLAHLSIGADDGLALGQIVEVIRLTPAAAYIGKMEVVEVQPDRSVGRQIAGGSPGGVVQSGDYIATKDSPRK